MVTKYVHLKTFVCFPHVFCYFSKTLDGVQIHFHQLFLLSYQQPNVFKWRVFSASQESGESIVKVDIYGWWFLIKLRYEYIYGIIQFCIESMNATYSYLSIRYT